MTTREKVLDYVNQVDHSPTVREIARHVGVSQSTVHHHILGLERDGQIRLLGEQRRIYPAKAPA
jgi:DNA-binding IclR family transcriptional regulator